MVKARIKAAQLESCALDERIEPKTTPDASCTVVKVGDRKSSEEGSAGTLNPKTPKHNKDPKDPKTSRHGAASQHHFTVGEGSTRANAACPAAAESLSSAN